MPTFLYVLLQWQVLFLQNFIIRYSLDFCLHVPDDAKLESAVDPLEGLETIEMGLDKLELGHELWDEIKQGKLLDPAPRAE